jgi:hypothetical protein
MSSIFVLPQSASVSMMTDGVIYDHNGVVMMTNLAKAYALPTFPAAVSCTGPAFLTQLMAQHISIGFASFDEFVDGADQWLTTTFNELAAKHRDGDAASSFYIVGWHEKENRPAAYSADLWTDNSTRIEQILENSLATTTRSKLKEQTTISGTPLNPELVDRCGFKLRRNDDYQPEVDLLHVTEVARQEKIEGGHWVGGKVLLTTIDAKGITQRVVHHYKGDRVGARIEPEPVSDWKAFRRELKGKLRWWK